MNRQNLLQEFVYGLEVIGLSASYHIIFLSRMCQFRHMLSYKFIKKP